VDRIYHGLNALTHQVEESTAIFFCAFDLYHTWVRNSKFNYYLNILFHKKKNQTF